MWNYSFTFDSPAYLLLLLLLPLLWWWSFESLSGLGNWRRLLALLFRTLVLTLIVLSLADVQYQRRSDQIAVIYLLDQSLSVPTNARQAMIQFVNQSVAEHQDEFRNDRYAVIVFGRDAAVEMPLVNTAIPLPAKTEALLDPEYTDLATAIQRAKAMFPHDSAKRIVIVTDGNENIGNARREARAAAATGVSIDVVPVMLSARREVSVEKLDLPANARRGQPFQMRIVMNNQSPKDAPATVAGKLRIIRRTGDREEALLEQDVSVPPGKRVFTVPEEIEVPDLYTYEARFSPNDPADDGMPQNNSASAFTHVRGQGHVLLIEDWDKQGQFDYLVDRLRTENITVTVMPSDRLFTSLAELQRYDSIVLANVSRSSGTNADNVVSFSDAQVSILESNTRELGCGLVMIGGPDTFGAGGWTNTDLEKAMPVDFEIKNAKVTPVGALALMMHAGEMPQANYWQKRIAFESIKMLGSRDYCGLVRWNGNDSWLWGQSQGGMIRVGPSRRMMLARVDQMTIGDMPAFDGGMKLAATAFANVQAAVKHMIIISDGDPTPPSRQTLQLFKQQKVKISTVAVGSHGILGSQEMQRIATFTGGKYYEVKSANALPKIYQQETRRIARPLVYEPPAPLTPVLVSEHEIVDGLEDGVPPISGFVLTSVKQNPLVQVILQSPLPASEKNSTVLASWKYGAGKAAAFTTDAGHRWASAWTGWDGYDKFFSQLVRWSMRPTDDSGNFSIATNVRDESTQVIITALDQDESFLNDLAMSGTVIKPDMTTAPFRIEQTAPGRYVGEFPTKLAGSYLLAINTGSNRSPLRSGVNVGYSSEYRDHQTNMALLRTMAELAPKDAPSGTLIEKGLDAPSEQLLALDPFRRDLPPAVSNQSVWPWLIVVGSCIFLGDVFVRRVQLSLAWIVPWLAAVKARVLGRRVAAPVTQTMERLRTKKQEIGEQIERHRASRRYETKETEPGGLESAPTATEAARPQPHPPQDVPQKSSDEPEQPAEESYTERLLKAKRQVWKERGNPPDEPNKKES